MADFETKDSGKRAHFESGMQRDTQESKPRFDLLLPHGVPYEEQFLTRFADLLARGADKYTDRNWEQASGDEELARFKASAFRHFMAWMCGEVDEDHATGTAFNILAYETTIYKLKEVSTDDAPNPHDEEKSRSRKASRRSRTGKYWLKGFPPRVRRDSGSDSN
jgi:hypothetical protein